MQKPHFIKPYVQATGVLWILITNRRVETQGGPIQSQGEHVWGYNRNCTKRFIRFSVLLHSHRLYTCPSILRPFPCSTRAAPPSAFSSFRVWQAVLPDFLLFGQNHHHYGQNLSGLADAPLLIDCVCVGPNRNMEHSSEEPELQLNNWRRLGFNSLSDKNKDDVKSNWNDKGVLEFRLIKWEFVSIWLDPWYRGANGERRLSSRLNSL